VRNVSQKHVVLPLGGSRPEKHDIHGSDEIRVADSKTAPKTPAPDCGTFNVVETQLDLEIKAVQAKTGLGYERSAFLAVEAQVRYEHAGQNPKIRTELEKFEALAEGDPAFEASKYAQLLAEARKLMEKNSLLTFGGAIQLAHENHLELRSIKHGGPRSPGDKVKAQQ
jgi:hypothetical protein